MAILVLNSGSSSIKFSFYEVLGDGDAECLFDAEVSGIGMEAVALHVLTPGKSGLGPDALRKAPHTLGEAIHAIFDLISKPGLFHVGDIGYRVVHPGSKLTDHVRITAEVLEDLEEAIAFAPLHEPSVLELIRAGMARFPLAGQFACFDTIFHRTMPEEATTYPIAKDVREQGVRRYGFHGLSCESVLYQFKRAKRAIPKRSVLAHLGSGCSVTALLDGRSMDTSMGLTPTGGVVMGTRPGDLDPGLVLYVLRQQKGGLDEAIRRVERMLNQNAGMVALTSLPNDMKAVRQAAADGNGEAALALKVFTRSITKAIGAYTFLLGGLDALVFTGGIGEHDAATRTEILCQLGDLGVELDAGSNLLHGDGLRPIHASNSKTEVFIVPAQEDLMIAMHVACMAGSAKYPRAQ